MEDIAMLDRAPSHFADLPPCSASAGDRVSLTMFRAYRSAGGVARGDEVASLLRRHSDEPVCLLAHWIISREILSFRWRSRTYIPMFQFDLSRMSVRPGVRQVTTELLRVFDDWELAHWFVQPNSWLAGAAPVDAISRDLLTVVQAAQADRFAVMG